MSLVIKKGEGKYYVKCVKCKQDRRINCTPQQLFRWNQGDKVQDAMPNVPASERELLISGYCGECWDNLFKKGGE